MLRNGSYASLKQFHTEIIPVEDIFQQTLILRRTITQHETSYA